jgi:hypothetical protein
VLRYKSATSFHYSIQFPIRQSSKSGRERISVLYQDIILKKPKGKLRNEKLMICEEKLKSTPTNNNATQSHLKNLYIKRRN